VVRETQHDERRDAECRWTVTAELAADVRARTASRAIEMALA
jgi:hypothetical protein